MDIVVTAGATREPIDSVRSITNRSTGRLGSMIADALAQFPEVETVYYICGKGAQQPQTPKASIIPIGDSVELEAALATLAKERQIAAIIHSMAVGDYRVKTLSTLSALAQAGALETGVIPALQAEGKLSSDVEDLVLILEKTPKIIAGLRDLWPQGLLVGFKLLDHVSTDQLISVSLDLLRKNRCDFVLANDMKTVASPCHIGHLLNENGVVQSFQGKDEIAKGLAQVVMEQLRQGQSSR